MSNDPNDHRRVREAHEAGPSSMEGGGAGAPGFDADRYLPLADELDVPDEQKEELLRTLFEIMKCFVDLGLDVRTTSKMFPDIFCDEDYMLDCEQSRNKE